jgi:pimeloyl-ACP methyl ester carboxylesterase
MTSNLARLFLLLGLIFVGFATPIAAADTAPKPVKQLILPGESFLVEGRPAFIMWPAEDKRQQPQPWVMYAPTLPGLPDSHEKWMHEQFLAAGVAVAGIDAGEAFGSPAGQKLMTALHAELTGKRGFAARPCLLGRSRGGLNVSSWAIAQPDKVAGIAGIYPVFDLRSYPKLTRAAPAYQLTVDELEQRLAEHNPIARVDVLAKAKIPVCIIHGDVDKVVPLAENSAALAEQYRLAGAQDAVKLIVPPGQGHNYWEGFFRCQELIDFTIARAKAGATVAAANESAYQQQAAVDATETVFPGKQSDWNGFKRFDFEVDGKPVLVVTPEKAATGKPWVWHGEFFGHKPAPDIALLKKGFHIVYLRVPDMLGSPTAVGHWNACYRELTTKYGLANKVALVGLSRGGLYCYNWASANPEKVACIYGDAPVCDFKSWPGGKGKGKGSVRDWKLVLEKYGFANEAEALAYTKNPVDSLAPLAQAKVPLLHVYGDADDVVPWDENTRVIAERYRKLGGSMTLIAKPGVGHHPHGLDDPTPIVEFIEKHSMPTN